MPLARFSGVVVSAMNACAVGMVAPMMPANDRDTKSSASVFASPKPRYDTNDPKRPIRMTGRRPMRSDSRPHIGAKMNCISEKEVPSRPTVSAVPPKCSA